MNDWLFLNEENIPVVFQYVQEGYRRGFLYGELNLYECLKYPKKRMFKIEEGCLLLIRRSNLMNTYNLKFIMPPMSLDQNYDAEEKLLKKYLNAGFSCFTNEEFLKQDHEYEVSKSRDFGGVEFLYSKDILSLAGKKYQNQRNTISRYEKLLKEGKIIKKWLNYDPQMVQLYHKWSIQTEFEKSSNFIPYLKMLPENMKVLCHYDENGKLFHFQVNLKVLDHVWNAVHKIKDYDYFKELNFGWLGDYVLYQDNPAIQYVLLGSTHKGEKDLFFSKSRLPYLYMQNKVTIRLRKTTKEDYAQVLQPTNRLFGIATLF